MNRRTFIKVAATTTAVLTLTACQRAPEATVMPSPPPKLIPTMATALSTLSGYANLTSGPPRP